MPRIAEAGAGRALPGIRAGDPEARASEAWVGETTVGIKGARSIAPDGRAFSSKKKSERGIESPEQERMRASDRARAAAAARAAAVCAEELRGT